MKFKLSSGKMIEVNKTTPIELLSVSNQHVHWFWWVFWFLLCWPVLIILTIVGCTRKQYVVKIGEQFATFNKEYYQMVMQAMNEEPRSQDV